VHGQGESEERQHDRETVRHCRLIGPIDGKLDPSPVSIR
jgi:hypothetical protein